MTEGQGASRQERARTIAVMWSTIEQLKLTAQVLSIGATASPSPETATRLHALAAAVSAQADDIQQRADRLTEDNSGA